MTSLLPLGWTANSISDLIENRDRLSNEIDKRVREGVDRIDRLVWTIDDEPYAKADKRYKAHEGDYANVIPKTFGIDKFKLKNGNIQIQWSTYFRSELDEYGTFEIPASYFDDSLQYEAALERAKKAVEQEVLDEEARLQAEEAAAP